MQLDSKKLSFYIGNEETLRAMSTLPALPPFAEETVDFLRDLSKHLMKYNGGLPDVITFAFWCRRAAVEGYRANYSGLDRRLGRGMVFHVAPSNVPVNFAFTLTAGLLAGNANVVRLPSKDFPQVRVICDAIRTTLKENHSAMALRICLVRYSSASKETNDELSQLCNTRVIWGGDHTIEEIRQSPLRARANEITFADRYSLCVIDSVQLLKTENIERVVQDFYNDTYLSDQNACTSPRLVVWLGDEVDEAQKIFWTELRKLALSKYELAPVQAIGKLSAFCRVAVAKNVKLLSDKNDGYVTRIGLEALDSDIMNYKFNSGFFFEYRAHDLKEILPLCTERCQTLSYFGLDNNNLLNLVQSHAPRGVDRIVPIGATMNFSLVWDGVDLIERMSREIHCC